jgi:hypothetical protein
MVLIFVGVDNSGKTIISKELSKKLNIPVFQNPKSKEYFILNYTSRINILKSEGDLLYNFLKQTKYNIILDRGYPCEWVYSKIFKRKTDYLYLINLDLLFSTLNTFIIYCYKEEYINFKDDIIDYKYLDNLNNEYKIFLNTITKCKKIFLNTTDQNLEKQIKYIEENIK